MLETDELDPNATYPTVDENDITFSTTPDGKIIGREEHIVNILLIGQDRREGEGRARSDSMILVSFNKNTNKITMASFLRDNYVPASRRLSAQPVERCLFHRRHGNAG